MARINKVFKLLPYKTQNLAISFVNTKLYYTRHKGQYKKYRQYYARWENATREDLDTERLNRLKGFLRYTIENSPWYKDRLSLNKIESYMDLNTIPTLNKTDIINNYSQIKTIDEKEGIISLTGGTTGASMKVIYTKEDMQERFAILDHFRAKHGYKLGKKTAWFSGKNLISQKDIDKGICSHYDFINKIRFYSTFQINKKNFDVYWNSLSKFKPEFIVGFPSSVYQICEIADSKGLTLEHRVKVFFPTAETVLPHHREVIGRVLGCKLVDQYASSEGAPFILECNSGNLHIHPLTGIFEVVDNKMQPTTEGEILVTSFTTHGTPLVRYRIGDSIKLAPKDKTCPCGSIFPLVDRVNGRSNDFLYSPTKGKINSNLLTIFTKDIDGLVSLQAIQEDIDSINFNIVINHDKYSKSSENKLHLSLKELVGDEININIEYVEEIPKEKSGKFRMVKNNLKLDKL